MTTELHIRKAKLANTTNTSPNLVSLSITQRNRKLPLDKIQPPKKQKKWYCFNFAVFFIQIGHN